MSSRLDLSLMARALQLAARGRYTTMPNPAVGCVIASGDRVIGEGWHERAGESHAEIHALSEAVAQPKVPRLMSHLSRAAITAAPRPVWKR